MSARRPSAIAKKHVAFPMLEFFRRLFFTSDFMPHGHCYFWRPEVLWLHVISDGLITLAYFSIPLALLYFVRKRRDIAFEWMFVMFGVFICACGTTHLLEIVTVWSPVYRLAGLVKAVTATASVLTGAVLWRIMPRLIALPSPSQLEESNRQLEREVASRKQVEEALRGSRDELEERVRARTAELARANAELRTEIAARMQAEEEVRASQRQFQDILDYAPIPIFLKDRAGRYLLVNQSFSALTGIPITQLLGKTSADFFPAETVQEADAHNERVFATGKAQEFEETIPREDGTHVFLSLRFLLPGANGAPDTLGVITRDITERKRAEEAVQLAREEAERANAAKTDFLSRMSHELRTPLNAILGFGQLLEIDQPTGRQADAVGHILKGGRHLLGLVNEVLDLARVEAGHMSLSPEPVDAQHVFQESIDLLRPLAEQRGLSLESNFQPETMSWVVADRQRLKQILVNLLSNAVKFNREGGGITTTCKRTPEGTVRLTVRDTGPGIALADQERIFSAFERLGADRRGVEGTGLGLALAKRLAELMHGCLVVESVVDEGSAFCLVLPGASAPEMPRVDTRPQWLPTASPSQTRTVLYIEDNISNYNLVDYIFADRPGLRLLPAIRGELGLKLAHEQRPDLILLDLDLPDLHGREVLKSLRADPSTREIPVVVISANALPRMIEQTLAAGAKAYLTKPINVRDFLDVLDEQLLTVPA